MADFAELSAVLGQLLRGALPRIASGGRHWGSPRSRGSRASLGSPRSPRSPPCSAGYSRLGSPGSQGYEGPSRLIVYSSSEATLVPRHVLQMCFCVQDVVRFFGVCPEPVEAVESGEHRAEEEEEMYLYLSVYDMM